MAIEIEDGSGKANAESYAAIAVINDYAVKRGLSFPITGSDGPTTAVAVANAEAAARRGTSAIDGLYRSRFPGSKRNGRGQALEWPRVGATDASGEAIAIDEIPAEIIAATCEASIRELASPGSLSPDVTPGKIKTRVRVEGAVDVSYAEGGGIDGQRPISTVIEDILAALLMPSRGATVELLRT